ncbi:hypothetical protein ACPXB3_19675 [Gordonia sp. DT219]|uniref:hypothetical protein n=1 Tax=Gordonia sp. DT219 TaxID=3416658 RepID=UPI003CF25E08
MRNFSVQHIVRNPKVWLATGVVLAVDGAAGMAARGPWPEVGIAAAWLGIAAVWLAANQIGRER